MSLRLFCIAMLLLAAPALTSEKPTNLAPNLVETIKVAAYADKDQLIPLFKDLHQHPELGFMETRTAGILAKELTTLGFDVREGVGGTGVVAILRNGDGPTVMYRADMDGTAVLEKTGLPYISRARTTLADGSDVPVSHLCGHDAHVTWMIGAARILVALKDQWSGTLILVGQPAEEIIEGATAMVNDGLYDNTPVPDTLFALHTAPLPTGTVGMGSGAIMAGTDQIDVRFNGIGGHGSSPHLTLDPVVMAATAVLQYQTVVARTLNPQETGVLTVGAIQAGTTNNVIPDSALLKLNLRYYKPQIREQLIAAIERINEGVAQSYGVPEALYPTMTFKGASTPLVNDTAVIDHLTGAVAQLIGSRSVFTGFPPALGSEDAHLLKGPHTDIIMAYFGVGIIQPELVAKARTEGRQVPFFNHSPEFFVDLDAIPLGVAISTVSILELLAYTP